MKRRQWTTPEKEKHQSLGENQSKKRRENCQKVYEVILAVQEATTSQIHQILKKRNEALAIRTIERCVKEDDRIIKKNNKYYTIDEWARLETRYLNPLRFGVHIWSDVVSSESFTYDDVGMRKMLEMFGAILIFVFIEASRPFHDKLKGKGKMMTDKDRNDLVKHWALNSIPLDFMFRTFISAFNYRMSPAKPFPAALKRTGETRDEMNELQIRECFDMLRRNCPDVYNDLANAKDRFYENSLSGKELTKS